MVTAVKTGRLLEVDTHPDFGTPLIVHKAFLSTWCRTFMHTREKDIFFLNALKISLAPTLQEGPFQVMCVRKLHVVEQKELNTCELESQDAARITSALADSRIQLSWSVMSTLVRTLCLCLALMTLFACQAFCDCGSIKTTLCRRVGQMVTGMLPSAVKTIIMKLWHSRGTTSTWRLTRII